jgi:hypothetical protein
LTVRLSAAESNLAAVKDQLEAQRAAEEFAKQLKKLGEVRYNS